MKRREFIASAGLLAGATMLATTAPEHVVVADMTTQKSLPTTDVATPVGRIDVHHHIVPPVFLDALTRKGLDKLTGTPLPKWTVEQSVALMDSQGIHTAITSLMAPGVYFGNDRSAAELARSCNEFAAKMAAVHPGRFGSFAVLPLPATESACVEATYALDTLHADGVSLMGSNDGVFLGDPRFDELMAELDSRHASVFLSPNLHPSSSQLLLERPQFGLELDCDTTRAALNLIFTGTLERYPHINWILSNGGGFLPYAAWRISLANVLPEFSDAVPQGVMTYLRRFYFDTALTTYPGPMAVLKELVEPTQLLYGSGFSLVRSETVADEIKGISRSLLWSPRQQQGIDRGNALGLFPRYATKGEVPMLAPVHESETTLHKWGRTLKKPIGALVQQLKN
ncbi:MULTISPECIES: amidohydrolase family protein [unclassified Pseudomonas]|uniref:amidohydrolase family protein n=1 Tax=unclassified Pseudomonas TaxID=196821 RepID=UPI0030D9C21C